MPRIIYYRAEPAPHRHIMLRLETHIERSKGYNQCIELTRHDIDIARINHLHYKKKIDARMYGVTKRLEELEAESRAADKNSSAYTSIEFSRAILAKAKQTAEKMVSEAKDMVDKLVQQLADLQRERDAELQKKRDEILERAHQRKKQARSGGGQGFAENSG